MKTLIRFLPFITFTVVSSTLGWRIAALAGIVALLIVELTQRPRRLGILPGAMGAFFAVLCVLAVVTPGLDADPYVHPVLAGWLGLVALASVVVGHPFTVDFSRDEVSAAEAASAQFVAINRSISLRWAGVFGGLAVIGFVFGALDRPLIGAGAAALLLLFGFKTSAPPSSVHHPVALNTRA